MHQSNPEAAFLKGHLAILLGLACEGAEMSSVTSLLKDMPGPDDRARLDAWIDSIRDFVALYVDLARGFAQAINLSRRQNDETQDSEDTHQEDMSGPGDGEPERSGLQGIDLTPRVFNPEAPKGGERGVEIAERVIRVLSEFRG